MFINYREKSFVSLQEELKFNRILVNGSASPGEWGMGPYDTCGAMLCALYEAVQSMWCPCWGKKTQTHL